MFTLSKDNKHLLIYIGLFTSIKYDNPMNNQQKEAPLSINEHHELN